ncbi:MAG: hypothetical protein MJA29_13310, partial [Candidatus Omnitrophica bacterium]|nr:hypothetical protein [Candidatus Omnitrophota bacterium]
CHVQRNIFLAEIITCDWPRGFHNTGVNILLFADDIVLIADTEDELQAMLNVAGAFATKWSIKFNEHKSKVLVFGQKCDFSKRWALGNSLINECEEYKYLGVYIQRNLKCSYHISKYLKPICDRKIAAMKHTLSKNANVNRIEFGNTIWHQVIRPTIMHGSSAWGNISIEGMKMIQSIQYQCAKNIMKCSLNVSRKIILEELGWEDIETSINKARVKYFERIMNLDSERLTYKFFAQMYSIPANKNVWEFCKQIKSSFQTVGLDFMYSLDTNKNNIYKIFERFCKYKVREMSYNEANIYHLLAKTQKLQMKPYLKDTYGFVLSSLKFKARTGVIGLNADLKRMSMRKYDICEDCNAEVSEDIIHVLFRCQKYQDKRQLFLGKFLDLCISHEMEDIFYDFMTLSDLCKTSVLLDIEPVDDFCTELDHAFKLFLKECNSLRFSK